MITMIIQIYEIQTPAEAKEMISLGVDHIGSVLTSESQWKNDKIRDTVAYVNSTGAKSSLIPLFNTPDIVFRALDYYRPHIVHFCESICESMGDGNAKYNICEKLIHLQKQVKQRFPEISIMRSIPIARPGRSSFVPSLELARMFEPFSDYFLTDTLIISNSDGTAPADCQPEAGFVGITGKICDWNVAEELVKSSGIPVILAGGLHPDNVGEAVIKTCPAGVDSCTGTNAVDGKGRSVRFEKDSQKVRRFVNTARKSASLSG